MQVSVQVSIVHVNWLASRRLPKRTDLLSRQHLPLLAQFAVALPEGLDEHLELVAKAVVQCGQCLGEVGHFGVQISLELVVLLRN